MKLYVTRSRRLTHAIILVATLGAASCGSCNPTVTPLATGATRGTTTIDIYGRWVRTNDPLGRTQKIWSYRFQYVPTGTTVYANGTTSGPVLQPLDAGTVMWTIAPAGLAAEVPPTAQNPDANGTAPVTLRFGPPGRGSATLSVTITYGGATGTASTQFEVDSSAP